MYKSIPADIKKYTLSPPLYKLHKKGVEKSNFGLDNSRELIDGGFALYSSVDLKNRLGPVKTDYYRIGLIRKGTITFDIGLETFHPIRNSIVLGFPGQVFSLYDKSEDFFCYYMLFKDEFIAPSLFPGKKRFPFWTYSGIQSFPLSEADATEAEKYILKINDEIKKRKTDTSEAIRLYIQMILLIANRNYPNHASAKTEGSESVQNLFTQFVKLVSEHFLKLHKVSDYAEMLHVSPDYLNRIIKAQSGKKAHELIEEMILIEAKVHLLHSQLSVAEIAYRLDFSDPSHFNKFFRKLAGCTPLEYRSKSE